MCSCLCLFSREIYVHVWLRVWPCVAAWPDCESTVLGRVSEVCESVLLFLGLLCSMASLPRCLPLTTGSSCQWRLSAGKHCLRERKTGRKEPSKRETVEGRHENQRCLSVCLSVWLSIYLYILYMFYIYFSKCVCGCASQTFTGRSLGSSVSPPVKGGRIRDGEGERRGGIQAADRDLWADSVRLQAQQQSPCLCLSAHGGREWQKEWRGCWRKKWASKMSWKWKSRTREEVSQGIRQDQDWDVILFDSFFVVYSFPFITMWFFFFTTLHLLAFQHHLCMTWIDCCVGWF